MLGRGPGAGVRLLGPPGVAGAAGLRGGWAGEEEAGGADGAAGVDGAGGDGGAVGAGAAAEAAAAAGRTGAVGVGPGLGTLDRTGAAGAAAFGLGRIGPGTGAAGRRVPIGLRLALGAEAEDSLPEPPLDSFSFSRRSTGGSTVEEAERTNSPMSFNIVRTVLLSTPSSFASS